MNRISKLLNRIVGFQQETVENIDWKAIWRQLKWMNTFSRGYRGRLAFVTGLSIFFTLLGVAYAYVYKSVVDQVISNIQSVITTVTESVAKLRYSSVWDKFLVLYDMLPDWIIWVLVGYVAYKIISYAFSVFMKFFSIRLSMDLALGIKRKVYATVLEGDWLSLTQYHSGDLVQRVTSDAETVSGFAMSTVPGMIVQLVQFIAAFSLLVYLDWSLTLIAFVGVPLYQFVIKLKGKRTRYYQKRSLELGAKHSSFMYESMANIMVIKSFMLVPEFVKRYRKLHEEMYDLTIEQTKYGMVTGVIIGLVGRVLSLGVTVFLLTRLLNGDITFGTLMAFGMLRSQVSGPVTNFMSFIMSSIEISASAERVEVLYQMPKDRQQKPEIVDSFAKKAEGDGMGLTINDLDFSYVKGTQVLHDVNVDVRPGETVAFVGPSGEGKTTLIRLALGLLTPDRGSANLTTGKGDTLDLSVETRTFFSYVPQGNTMFSGTIRENMDLGKPGASDEEIIQALKDACIWDMVSKLPEGLDTKIGERGIGVSEGQAQRLAIARALLRGAPILLLDEATSALDIYTEKEVLDNIFRNDKTKTCVLTTHRPSVFTVCDKIYRVRNRTVELIKATRDQQVEF